MTTLGYVFLGWVLGVMTIAAPWCVIVSRREDAEQSCREASWDSIMEVHDDAL